MTDEYLDKVLIIIKENDGSVFKEQLMRSDELDRVDNYFDAAIRHLVNLDLLLQERAEHDYLLTITSDGLRLIETGGFRAQSQRNNAVAESNRIARSARLISIIAIIISALTALAVCYINLINKNS